MANSNFKPQPRGLATTVVHTKGHDEHWDKMPIVPPIITSAVFERENGEVNDHQLFTYGRFGNPTRSTLENCLAKLENAKYGLTFSCGIGAVTTITQLLNAGDHIICCDDVYAGTPLFFSTIATRLGIELDLVDATNAENIKLAIKKNTKLIWIETPTNPGLQVLDIEAIAKVSKSQPNIIFVVDNTFLSPYFQRPLELGADIVMYSLAKYLNGHSDVIMGAAVLNDDGLYQRLKALQRGSGNIPSPFDCYQVHRGIKTLAVRMEQHSKNSFAVAKYLESHPNIKNVLHPGLPSHPQHQIALRQSYGHSGMLSFYIKGGINESRKFLKALKVFTVADSLGGVESLMEIPSLMSHSCVSEDKRIALGITDNFIRTSIGIEDARDLIEDLEQALSATFNA